MHGRMYKHDLGPEIEEWTNRFISAAIEVHRALGPGYLEAVYLTALCLELTARQIPFKRQHHVNLTYRDVVIGKGFCDLLIADMIVVELKAVAELSPVHEAQLISYLKMTGCKLGLLINFNVPILKDGLRRLVHPSVLRS